MRMVRPTPKFFSTSQAATDERRFERHASKQSQRKWGNNRQLRDSYDEHACKRLSVEKHISCVTGHNEMLTVLEGSNRHGKLGKGSGMLGRHESVKLDLNATPAVTFSRAHSNGNNTAKQASVTREQDSSEMSGGVHGCGFGLNSDLDSVEEGNLDYMEILSVQSFGIEREIVAPSVPKDAKLAHGYCLNLHVGCCGAADCHDEPCFSSRTMVENEANSQSEHQLSHCGDQGHRSRSATPAAAPRVLVDVTNKFQISAVPATKKKSEEDDAHRLSQRYKQIEFGKNTLGYEHYIELVPKWKRTSGDPKTPNPKQLCSKRSWDGQIRKWRRMLHDYDPPLEEGEELAEDFTALKSSKRLRTHEDVNDCDGVDDDASCNRVDGSEGSNSVGEGKKKLQMSIYEDWLET